LSKSKNKDQVTFRYKENGAKVVKANLIYTTNGGERYEEWFRKKAIINDDGSIKVNIPKDATHYLINVIDEYGFLVSYPEIPAQKSINKKKKESYATFAIRNK